MRHKDRFAARDDARDGQGLEGDRRRRAGGHRLHLLHGGRGPPPARLHDARRDARQVRHVRAPARRPLRTHHAVELPDGDPLVEAHPGAGLRQHGRHQARRGHAALDLQSGQGVRRGGRPRGRRQHGDGPRRDRGRGAHRAPFRQTHLVHRLDRDGPRRRLGLRRAQRHLLAGDGRQERHHRDGRRRR